MSVPTISSVKATELQRGPETMFFDPRIAWELAAQVGDPQAILAQYGYTDRDAFDLVANPAFQRELRGRVANLEADGLTYMRRAEIIADDALAHAYEIMTDPKAPAAVRMSAIQWITKIAGREPKEKNPTNTQFVLEIKI